MNTTGGAAAVPGVVSGQFDFAFGNVVSLIVAKSQGLELTAVARGQLLDRHRGPGLQRRRRAAGQLDHRRRRPDRQDRGRQQPQERRRHDGPRLHPQGRRRPDEGEVRRAAVPGHAGRAREQARRRRLDRRAVLHRRAGPGREGHRLQLRRHRAEHDGRDVLHLAADDRSRSPDLDGAVHRRDQEVPAVRAGPPGRGPPGAADLHADQAGGRGEDHAPGLAAGDQQASPSRRIADLMRKDGLVPEKVDVAAILP